MFRMSRLSGRTCILILAFAVLFWFGFNWIRFQSQPALSTMTIAETEPTSGVKTAPGDAQEERSKLRDTWLTAAEKVAKESGVPEARQVIDFAKKNGILASPNAQGQKFLEGGRDESWFAVIPMLEGDQEVSERWKFLSRSPAAAHFLPEGKALVLKTQSYSEMWKGVIFLHEANHAKEFVTAPYDWTDPRTFCHAELRTHELQNKIMRGIGGVRYDAAVQRQMLQCKAALVKEGQEIGTAFADRSDYDPLLDEIFGKAESLTEKDARQTHLWVDSNFRLIDESFSKETAVQRSERKALFLKMIYAEGGVLPGQ